MAKNSGKKWTSSDKNRLRNDAKNKVSTPVIARHLGRTQGAVKAQASKSRISLMPKDK